MLSGFSEGMKCKVCKKSEADLEKVGIVLNIPLETCMKCLKQNIEKPSDTKQVIKVRPKATRKHIEAIRLLEDLVVDFDVVLAALENDQDPLELIDFKDAAEQFFDTLKKAAEIVNG